MPVNSFAVVGIFEADSVLIRCPSGLGLPITFAPEHAQKIESIKNGQIVTATGRITFPNWNQYLMDGVCPAGFVLDIAQISITVHQSQLDLRGSFSANLAGWGEYDGMFAICEDSDGGRIYCFVPAVHERLARSRRDYLIGRHVRFDCRLDHDQLVAQKMRIIDEPVKKPLLLSPHKGCQAWDDLSAQGWPQARTRKVSSKLRREVFWRDGFRCRECGSSPDKNQAFLEVDHIIPFSRGGSTTLSNLQTLCSECNAGKSDGMPHPAALASMTP